MFEARIFHRPGYRLYDSLSAPGCAEWPVAPVGSGVFEARIFHRPGYRLYFIREGNAVIVLLCGGDKGNQDRDIERAIEMAKERE